MSMEYNNIIENILLCYKNYHYNIGEFFLIIMIFYNEKFVIKTSNIYCLYQWNII